MKQYINILNDHDETMQIEVDLPVLDSREGSVNVKFKGRNVYVGKYTYGGSLCVMVSDDMNEPKYDGSIEVYAQRGLKLSELLEKHGLYLPREVA